MVFYDRHVIRLKPIPEHIQRAMDQAGQVYLTMNGPSEFHVIGTIKDWDRTARLGEIHIPTLITSGRYDESTPRINEVLHNGIAGSKWVLFNMAHVEERKHYLATGPPAIAVLRMLQQRAASFAWKWHSARNPARIITRIRWRVSW